MHAARLRLALVPGVVLGLVAQPARAQPEEAPSGTGAAETTAVKRTSEATGDEHRVTVIAPPNHPTLPVLRAELEALGLTIEELPPAAAADDSRFRIVLGDGQIEVGVHDPQTHRTIVREVFTQADASPVERLTAVLHTVELVRTQLNAPPPRPAPIPEPAPEPPPPPPERHSGWMLSAVPHFVYSPGGTTLGGGAEMDVVRHWSRVGIRGFASIALLPNRQVASEGTAEARPRFGGVQGVWVANREGSPWVATVGAGVALVGTRLSASAEPGFRAEDDHLFTVAPIVDLRVGAQLDRHVSLVAAGAALTPLRSDRMVFGDREVARHGAALLTGGVGVQIHWP